MQAGCGRACTAGHARPGGDKRVICPKPSSRICFSQRVDLDVLTLDCCLLKWKRLERRRIKVVRVPLSIDRVFMTSESRMPICLATSLILFYS